MLKDKILFALQNRIDLKEKDIDINQEFKELIKNFDLYIEDTGGSVNFIGKDPVMPSTIKFASATALALAAKAAVMAAIWKQRTGEGQDIEIDIRKAAHRLSPFFLGKFEKINGFSPGFPQEITAPLTAVFYKTKDGRHVIPVCPYDKLKLNLMKLLNVPEDPTLIAAAIAQWNADDLENKAIELGIPLLKLRTVEEFLATEQFDVLQHMPIVQIEKIGNTEPIPFKPNPKSPLDGIKALGMGHIIAGAGTGRALALHGADVLNIWSLNDQELESLYATANVGMRSAKLDQHTPEGKAKIRELLKDADIFFGNRRQGYLEKLGLSAEEVAAIKPGIIYVTVSLFGEDGPWSNRVGFDFSAGAVVGINTLEGTIEEPAYPPIHVINDFIVSWIMTTGAVSALMKRAKKGGSYKIHVSLTRVALWMLSLGIYDKEYANHVAGLSKDHLFLDPELFSAETSMGTYQGLTDQVQMTKTPGHYKHVLMPRGAGKAEWEC
jgi:crotonobetainyl-CoA:carnitine CoA-transferase CaiB-like acyl-CoA transferase